uniref:Luminescence regulatory protein luxO.Transcriptional regulator, Fis family n=1 Tax=Magnetococcus massalia (strain MO-1) TaxID=451514 RepID=A0A1S7LM54_MAGMO|nr:Luminescence regulatory protein luxO.Transcriptional regulator, Fis family [Candidatus Magnetococcus massalia]
MQPTLHDLILVEDSRSMAMVYQQYLRSDGRFRVQHMEQGEDVLEHLEASLPEVILLDLQLPDMDGFEILKAIHERQLPIAVVIITAHGSVDRAVEATRLGAFDFLEKPFSAKRLQVTLSNAIKQLNLVGEVTAYRDTYDRDQFHGFIGASSPMQAVYRTIENAAPSRATVFITGESGTGKEVCAEAIHKQSGRAIHPFVAINCAAIPKDLIESELFGHVRGAFTGAVAERQGAAQRADGGTLFLDEIGELPLDLQSKLLRFLQTGYVQQVGGQKGKTVDVRILCATNREPWKEVQAGHFREDLYYRLNVIPLHLPPLRERGGDILLLARALLSRYVEEEQKLFEGFTPQAELLLQQHSWPGNVRELQNVIRHSIVLNSGQWISPEMLPALSSHSATAVQPAHATPPMVQAIPQGVPPAVENGEIQPLWLEEKRIIERALELCAGSIPLAAAKLGINPSTIYRKKQLWKEKLAEE